RPDEAALLAAQLDEQGHVVEQAALIGAVAAGGVGARHVRQQIAARGPADLVRGARAVVALDGEERDLVETDQRRDGRARGQRRAQLPRDAARGDLAATGMAAAGDAAVALAAGAG